MNKSSDIKTLSESDKSNIKIINTLYFKVLKYYKHRNIYFSTV